MFLGGEASRCKGILAIPIQTKVNRSPESKPTETELESTERESQVYGVLKVENPRVKDSIGRFTSKQEEELIKYAESIAKELEKGPEFWKEFVRDRENLKVSYINELLERGKPIGINLSQSLTYVNIFFKTYLECKNAVHIFWRSGDRDRIGDRDQCHILYLPEIENNCEFKEHKNIENVERISTEDVIAWINSNAGPDTVQKQRSISTEEIIAWINSNVGPDVVQKQRSISTEDMIAWINSNIGPEIVQTQRPISIELWQFLFPEIGHIEFLPKDQNPLKECQYPLVDIIRLTASDFDLGAIVLPTSPLLIEQKEILGNSAGMDLQRFCAELTEAEKAELTEAEKAPKQITEAEKARLAEAEKARLAEAEKVKKAELRDRVARLAINEVSIIGRFIEDEYETKKDTYLPLHRPPHSDKTCAILFADMRNFSTLVQTLRMSGKIKNLGPLMNLFSEAMGKIIGESGIGRVDKFMGDGVMALFGEDLKEDYDDAKVVVAVYCALKMQVEFNIVYKEWWKENMAKKANGDSTRGGQDNHEEKSKVEIVRDFRKTFNEDVEVSLTIGINIGQVYLDYFGDDSHREYTAIGDHVNFTQRIRDFAGEYDESLLRKASDILMSQTAYHYLDGGGYLKEKKDPIWLRFKGFGLPYPIYELSNSDLNYEKIVRKIAEIEEIYTRKNKEKPKAKP